MIRNSAATPQLASLPLLRHRTVMPSPEVKAGEQIGNVLPWVQGQVVTQWCPALNSRAGRCSVLLGAEGGARGWSSTALPQPQGRGMTRYCSVVRSWPRALPSSALP